MANKKAPEGGRETYVTQIRISETLALRIKEFSENTGASFNSIVCIALSTYLK